MHVQSAAGTCTGFTDLWPFIDAMTAACADPSCACVVDTGNYGDMLPSNCAPSCAGALLSMQSTCADTLRTFGMQSAVDAAAARCPPPPAPQPSCETFRELQPLMAAMTAACCPACPRGFACPSACVVADTVQVPSTCNAPCAEALLPLQSACADTLQAFGMLGVLSAVDAAAATCPPTASDIPCSTFGEFGAATQVVTDACCGRTACEHGLPTSCDQRCASVLLPFRSACSSMLANMDVARNQIDSAIATCGVGGGH